MVKMVVKEDCGNSPRKLFLKQLNIAFAEGDLDFFTDKVSEDISWTIVGDRFIQAKPDFLAELGQMKDYQVVELIIHKIITHGREGAVNGELALTDGKRYAYCDVCEFSGAKGESVKSIQLEIIKN